MKKLTDKKLANILGITPQNIVLWKKNKSLQYKAVRGYFLLKENNFFESFKKIKALAELIGQECDSKYTDDLIKLVEKGDEVIKEILNIDNKTKRIKNETCNSR